MGNHTKGKTKNAFWMFGIQRYIIGAMSVDV